MTSEALILVAIGIGYVGTVIALVGLIGWRSAAEPRCRTCGADVRPVAWDAAPRCPACGASLQRRGGIRLGRRRVVRRIVVVGTLLCLVALGLWQADRALLRRDLAWRDLRPVGWDVDAIQLRGDVQAVASIERRIQAERLAPETARAALAACSRARKFGGMSNEMLRLLRVASDDVSAETVLGPILDNVALAPHVALGEGDAVGLQIWLELPPGSVGAARLVLVPERIAIDGREVVARRRLNPRLSGASHLRGLPALTSVWIPRDDLPADPREVAITWTIVAVPWYEEAAIAFEMFRGEPAPWTGLPHAARTSVTRFARSGGGKDFAALPAAPPNPPSLGTSEEKP